MLALGHVFSTWFHLKKEMKRNEKNGRKKKIKAFKKNRNEINRYGDMEKLRKKTETKKAEKIKNKNI